MKASKPAIAAISLSHLYRNAVLIVILIVSFTSLIIPDGIASAAEPVSARYLGVSGDTVRLRITIGSPSPQNMILEQYLPPGAQMVGSSPSARQVRNSGVVKWLFKNVSPGNIEVSMRVSPPAAAKNIGGTLRYRMPGGGKMQELRISY